MDGNSLTVHQCYDLNFLKMYKRETNPEKKLAGFVFYAYLCGKQLSFN
jgi:hypothetical protein